MRILIAGKTTALRNALRRYLQERSDYNVVGTAADKARLVGKVETEAPDLLLFDEGFVGDPVREIILPIRQLESGPQIIVLSSRPKLEQVYLDAGAAAYVSKSAPPKTLLSAIEEIRLRGNSA